MNAEQLIKYISLLSNGLFAGIGINLSLSSVPAIQESKDKLTVWRRIYLNSSKLAILNILVSSGCHSLLYFYTSDIKYIYAGLLSFASFPFTLFCIRPVNNELFYLYDKKEEDDRVIKPIIEKWNYLQWFRTFFGISAFMLNLFIF